MYYEIMLTKGENNENIRQFERNMFFHGLKQMGIFPTIPDFYLYCNKLYEENIRNLDCLGICYYPGELELIKHYKFGNKLIHYPYQEPDRSSPSNEKTCYLPYFKNKKILLICPFAEVLR